MSPSLAESASLAPFTAAAWADRYDGRIHGTPYRNVTLAMNEPMGVVGMLMPDDHPLLALAKYSKPQTCHTVPSTSSPATGTSWPRR
ncbi:MAG: hypothetical protein LW865_17900 [Betaproteobacteria bacterium]|nr:hypothetical protein [Betaproteobacteria bacterium]